MKTLNALIAGAALSLASISALAQVAVPPPPYPDQIPNSDTDNGGLIFTLFSIDPATPYSYAYNLGLRLNDVLPTGTGMTTPGLTLTWSLPTLLPPGTALANLRWHVTAGDAGTAQEAFSARFLTTALIPDAQTITTSRGSIITAATARYFNFVGALNGLAGNPDIVTNIADPAYAGVTYDADLNAFSTFVPSGRVGDALSFFFMTNNGGGTVTAGLVQRYQAATGQIGRWFLDLANQTLTYSVAPIPLPAAVWLLLSGLVGLGAVARRKSVAA